VRRRSALLSPAFIALYVAVIGAVSLHLGRKRWGSANWYPFAVGLVGATAIIPLKNMLERALLTRVRSGTDWLRVLLFFVAAVLPLLAVPFVLHDSPLLAAAAIPMSLLFLYGSFGTLFRWPGFRPPTDECDLCGYCVFELTEISGDVCPNCERSIDGSVDGNSKGA